MEKYFKNSIFGEIFQKSLQNSQKYFRREVCKGTLGGTLREIPSSDSWRNSKSNFCRNFKWSSLEELPQEFSEKYLEEYSYRSFRDCCWDCSMDFSKDCYTDPSSNCSKEFSIIVSTRSFIYLHKGFPFLLGLGVLSEFLAGVAGGISKSLPGGFH